MHGLFTNWKFGIVFDPRLHDLLLYLSFSTLYFGFFWKIDTIVFAKLNMSPVFIKPSPSNGLEINMPLGGLLEDLRY